MKLKNFNEEFLTSIKGKLIRNEPIEVYVNPTFKDFMEASPQKPHEVRFIAVGKTKKVYIFNASSAIHSEVAKDIGLYGQDEGWAGTFNLKNRVLLGNAKQVGEHWVMDNSDSLLYWINAYPSIEIWQKSYLHFFDQEDWSWINKWIDVTSMVSKFKQNYEHAVKSEMSESSISHMVRKFEYEKSR